MLFVALLHRALESKQTRSFAASVALIPALAIVHPFSGIALAVPGALLSGVPEGELGARQHVLIWLAVSAGLATALVWVFPAYRFKHYVTTADSYLNARLEYVFYDLFDILRNSDNTGLPVRTLFRTLCFAAGGVVLWRWRKAGDRRTLPLASLVLWSAAWAYLAAYTNAGRQTQPYRQIAPAMLAAAIPAAELLSELCTLESRRLNTQARLLLALAAVAIVPRVGRTVISSSPTSCPPTTTRWSP